MGEIDIGLTKAEFKHLLKMAYIGMYVLSESELESKEKRSDHIINKLLQIANVYKTNPGIEYSKENDEYNFDREEEENILEEYNDFIEDTFWDELIHNLARRDFIEKYGINKINTMTDYERIEKEHEFIDFYSDEIEKSGISKLRLQSK